MQVKVCVLLVFLTTIISINALKCNLCIGSLDSDCARNVSSSEVEQTCLFQKSFALTTNKIEDEDVDHETKPKLKHSCVFLQFEGSDKFGEMVQRGCGYMNDNKDICQFIRKKLKSVVKCKSCDSDMCN